MKKSKNNFASLLTFCILFLGFILSSSQQPASSDGYLRVAFLDVGQGDAALITTPQNKQILIDGGENSTNLFKALDLIFMPNKTVSLVIASHNHSDHIGGLAGFINKYQPEEIWMSGAVHTSEVFLNFLKAVQNAKNKGAVVKSVKAGDSKDIGNVKVKVLHPEKKFDQITPNHQHDATLVVSVNYGAIKILFTGDLETQNEQDLIQISKANLSSSVLKVSHHGSKYSTGEAFLNLTNPQIAIISAKKNNSYGHPHQETIERLENRNIKIYRTDKLGTIILKSDGINVWRE